MPLTAADWLEVLKPKLTQPLFEAERVACLCRLARELPGNSLGTLEVRLGAAAAQVDLSLRLLPSSQAAALTARFAGSPAGRFLSLWSDPGGPLAPVRSVWLEFDLDREEAPPPVVCAKLPAGIEAGWLTGTLLPALQGGPLSRSQQGRILACLGALPESARLLYVFSLRARRSNAVRLEIFGLEPGSIREYLQNVAPRAVAAVAKITPLFAGVERLHLSFDLTEEVLPRIGIEGSFPRQPSRESRWQELFGRLKSHGLCSPEKETAVLAWPGYDSFWTAPQQWPIAEIGPSGFCVRALSHVKVVCQPDGEPEAKAYLAFGPFERSSGAAPASSAARRSVLSA